MSDCADDVALGFSGTSHARRERTHVTRVSAAALVDVRPAGRARVLSNPSF